MFRLFIKKDFKSNGGRKSNTKRKRKVKIFLDKQMEHKFYTIFLISQMT